MPPGLTNDRVWNVLREPIRDASGRAGIAASPPMESGMNGSGTVQDPGTPACLKCIHYQITWDAHAPYGCRAHGFKSSRNPALVVFESSGLACQLFKRKEGLKPERDSGRA